MKYLTKHLTFTFDIGYASIGWAAILGDSRSACEPQILGSGVVLFPTGDCLASARRDFRRQRRNIRARRQRIERIGKILLHYQCIDERDLKSAGHPLPFLLAAMALQKRKKLTNLEAWHILRWYAHNRGYDGNAAWAGADNREDNKEDIEKVEQAKALMLKYKSSTMAETLCLYLGLNTTQEGSNLAVDSPSYKALGVAFPRNVIETELRQILLNSTLPSEVQSLILDDSKPQLKALATLGIKLPKRYINSILFGQLRPRFDNRIISRCPITWAKEYKKAIDEGLTEDLAKKQAQKYAKVPTADCAEFYEYRFARILANIRVQGQAISSSERQQFFERARAEKRFTRTSFKAAAKEILGDRESNLRNLFELHPDSDKALVFTPTEDKYKATGRAPYARPVLKEVVNEILRGEDATRPARSSQHPDGEDKEQDGILYSLLDPHSEVAQYQKSRRIDELTNNQLVRHRMLIFERVLTEMCKKYADGDSKNIHQFCIEVNRNLKEYSGLTARKIASKLSEQMKDFTDAKKYLAKHAPDLELNANLIRKCRIAIDMDWKCPFTGQLYNAYQLHLLEKEHIVPYANRKTNAMSALVLTRPEINKVKGKRTALEFVTEFAGKEIEGCNQSILTVSKYKTLVEKLKTSGSPDDIARKKKRKRLLLIDKISSKSNRVQEKEGESETDDLGFTDGQGTQSSQLMKLAMQVARNTAPHAKVVAMPGHVTNAIRIAWDAWGILAEVCPEVIDPQTKKRKEKSDIRNITHLHHAVDAIMIGIAPYLIPGSDNGLVWKALAKRKLTEKEIRDLKFSTNRKFIRIDSKGKAHLADFPTAVRTSIVAALREDRVYQHVPADMSGAKLELNPWGVEKIKDGRVYLRQHQEKEKGSKIKQFKRDNKTGELISESTSAVIGLTPTGESKLQKQNSVLVISSNYGLALDPEPTIIRHFKVYHTIQTLIEKNGGKPIRILKKGQVINIKKNKNKERLGLWKIKSIKHAKAGLLLDLQRLSCAFSSKDKHNENWLNLKIKTLLLGDFEIIKNSYIGD